MDNMGDMHANGEHESSVAS